MSDPLADPDPSSNEETDGLTDVGESEGLNGKYVGTNVDGESEGLDVTSSA
jgi:hypothetical protein